MSKKRKKPSKKVLILGAVGVALLAIVLFLKLTPAKSNYLTVTDSLLMQQTGSFRYVFDIRTEKHSENKKSDSISSLSSLENMEAGADVEEESTEEDKSNQDISSDWGNKYGIEVTDWKYPQYKVTLEGGIRSTDPLELNMKVGLATNYFNDTLTEIIVKDYKTYINIEQLRYWLTNSKDKTLVEIGMTLPEGSKYVMYEGDVFNLYSTYAEASEIDFSRESSILNLYKRFLIAYKTVVPRLSISNSCFKAEDEIYRVNISGDNAVSLLKSIKSMVLGVGDTHRGIINNQKNNGFLTDEQYAQAKRETDNISEAFSDLILFFNTTNLSDLDLQVGGSARNYVGGKGSSIYESALAFQFTANDTDYSVAVQLHRDLSTPEEVRVPVSSVSNISDFSDKDFMQKYMLKICEYLNISGVSLKKQLEITPESMRLDLLSNLVSLANEINSDNEDFERITLGTVESYIKKYRDFEVTAESSDEDKLNSTLVHDFLSEFQGLLTGSNDSGEANEPTVELERFPSLVYENSDFRIYANLNKENSNKKCVLVDCYILNKTEAPLNVDLSSMSLRTMQSSKYPANYESLLKEYNNSFDMSKALQSVEIQPSGYAKVSLYFIIGNELEYMDLWYGEEKCGVISSY